jgi:hypothetical protein
VGVLVATVVVVGFATASLVASRGAMLGVTHAGGSILLSRVPSENVPVPLATTPGTRLLEGKALAG